MSENLKKIDSDRYEYTDATAARPTGRKLIIERSALRDVKGGLAIRASDGHYVFVAAEDIDELIGAMQELRKQPCDHCEGRGYQ